MCQQTMKQDLAHAKAGLRYTAPSRSRERKSSPKSQDGCRGQAPATDPNGLAWEVAAKVRFVILHCLPEGSGGGLQ